MKPIRPNTETPVTEPGYPTLNEARTGRRDFLKTALGLTAGAGAVWLVDRVTGGSDASANPVPTLKKIGKWYQVTVPMPPYPYVSGAALYVCRIVVQTRSRKFANWLMLKTEQQGIRKAVLPKLKGITGQDVTNTKKLTRLRGRLGTALQKHYKTRTKTRLARPVVTLGLGSRWSCYGRRRPRLLGKIRSPHRP